MVPWHVFFLHVSQNLTKKLFNRNTARSEEYLTGQCTPESKALRQHGREGREANQTHDSNLYTFR